MERIPVYVGLDYHQDAVQVCVVDADGRVLANRSCRNDWRAIRDEAERHGGVVRVAIEACTGAANLAEQLVDQAAWSVDQAHPGYVSRMKQSPDKSDFTDARMLADLTRVGYLPRVWLPPQEVRDLRLLVRYRQQLARARRNTKLRIGAILREQRAGQGKGNRWTKAWIHWVKEAAPMRAEARWVVLEHFEELDALDARLRKVEDRLDERMCDDRIVRQLVEHKGIGLVTAWTIRAMVGRFDRFKSGKQLSRFCGLSPRNASSGARQADAGLVKAGDPLLRSVLIEAAHGLIRYDPRWASLATRMRVAGKKTTVIAAAVANRWMRRLFHEMQPQRLAA
jgi:transposase